MNGLWAWNTSLARDKEPTQPVWGCVEISFSDSRSVNALCLCLEHVCSMAPGQADCYICSPQGVDRIPFPNKKAAHIQITLYHLLGRTHWPWGDSHTLLKLILLFLLDLSKVLFRAVLDCVLLCLVTLIPRCSGQTYLESSPGASYSAWQSRTLYIKYKNVFLLNLICGIVTPLNWAYFQKFHNWMCFNS